MGRVSTKENKTVYQLAREKLGYSREKAAEETELEPFKIERIENEKIRADPWDVVAMAKAYKEPQLCNHYCANECPIGMKYVPEIKIKDLFLNGYAYLSSSLKLVAMPLIAYFICVLLHVPELIKWAIFFEFCMPSATQTLLFSEQYGNQPHQGSIVVLMSTIVSIATIPLMYLLMSAIGI